VAPAIEASTRRPPPSGHAERAAGSVPEDVLESKLDEHDKHDQDRLEPLGGE